MPREPKKEKQPKLVSGANQHRDCPIYKVVPNLAEILQGYIDNGIMQKDIPERILQDHKIVMKLRTVQKYMKKFGVLTARRNGLTAEQKKEAIDLIAREDPDGRLGVRSVKKRLALRSIHIPKSEVLSLRRAQDPEAADARECKRKNRTENVVAQNGCSCGTCLAIWVEGDEL